MAAPGAARRRDRIRRTGRLTTTTTPLTSTYCRREPSEGPERFALIRLVSVRLVLADGACKRSEPDRFPPARQIGRKRFSRPSP
jgi:hypothetical protein